MTIIFRSADRIYQSFERIDSNISRATDSRHLNQW